MSVSAGLWCVFQVTLVSTVALGLCVLFRKRGPSLRAEVAFLGLLAVGLVSLFAPLPTPSWGSLLNSWNESKAVDPLPTNEIENATPIEPDQSETPIISTANRTGREVASLEADPVWMAAWDGFVEALREPVRTEAVETASSVWNWPTILAWVYFIGLGLGVVRLATAWFLLRRECRGKSVDDVELQRFVSEWAGNQRATNVRIVESDRLTSAATTGWRRPVILLPTTWRSWSPIEREAVLAHELSHIVRRDWLTTFFAECVRTLHFYHPLVHWLAAWLRMDQELAADANAAGQVGGTGPYLKVLTQMALARSAGRTRWPVRAFLPTRRALMRRVDMLRKGTGCSKNTPRRLRWGLTLGVLTLGVVAVGLRPSAELQAQSDAPSKEPAAVDATEGNQQANGFLAPDEQAEPNPFNTSLRPREAITVFGIRPARLMQQPALAPFVKILQDSKSSNFLGVDLKDVEQIVLYFDLGAEGNRLLNAPDDGFGGMGMAAGRGAMMGGMGGQADVHPATKPMGPELAGMCVRSVGPLDQAAVVKQLTPNGRTGTYGGQIYLSSRESDNGFWFLDESSFAASYRKDGLRAMIKARNHPAAPEAWFQDHLQLNDIAGWVDIKRLSRAFPAEDIINPSLLCVWQKTETLFFSANFRDELQLTVTLIPNRHEAGGYGEEYGASAPGLGSSRPPSANAQQLEEMLESLVKLAKDMVRQNRQMVPHLPETERDAIGGMLQLVDAVLANAEVVRESRLDAVTLRTDLDGATGARLVALIGPALANSRKATSRALSISNLKQIMLAMHNYHDTYGHFPMPAVVGPDGKTRHSWRVALLPFLEEAKLYESYNLDEPWDSEHNQLVLNRMPKVFRHPLDDEDSTNASYFGFVGKETAFGTENGIEVGVNAGGGLDFGIGVEGGAGVAGDVALDGEGAKTPKTVQIQGVRLADILDGTSNTIFVVENKSEIPWTKPVDFKYDPKKRIKVGGWFEDGFCAGFADGSVRFIADSINPKTLQLLIERADGEPIPQPIP